MRFFKAGTTVRIPEDEAAAMRLMAIAHRLKPQDSSDIEIEPRADETAPETEPDTLR